MLLCCIVENTSAANAANRISVEVMTAESTVKLSNFACIHYVLCL